MNNSFSYGSVKIADEILDQIAVAAASDVYGVYTDDTQRSFGRVGKNPRSKVVKVGENLHFSLTINFDKKVNVRKSVKQIQNNVKNAVENMTQIPVTRVDVNIPSLEF